MRKIMKIAITVVIIWLAVMVALAVMPAAHGQSPQPTMASTSWQGPGPYVTSTPIPTPDDVIMWRVVWLPGVMR